MKNKIAFFLAALLVVVLAGAAGADEKILGRIKSIDLESKTVVITTYEGQEVTVTISSDDTMAFDKLKDGRIKVNDDVKVKYVSKGGRNVSTYFRKPAGC